MKKRIRGHSGSNVKEGSEWCARQIGQNAHVFVRREPPSGAVEFLSQHTKTVRAERFEFPTF